MTAFLTNFPKISYHFPKIFYLSRRPDERSRICSQNFRRLSRKTRRCFDHTPTNKYNLRDKLEISEIIDIFSSEDMEIRHSSPGCILSYEFYECFIFQ